jgi:hypothetical protein
MLHECSTLRESRCAAAGYEELSSSLTVCRPSTTARNAFPHCAGLRGPRGPLFALEATIRRLRAGQGLPRTSTCPIYLQATHVPPLSSPPDLDPPPPGGQASCDDSMITLTSVALAGWKARRARLHWHAWQYPLASYLQPASSDPCQQFTASESFRTVPPDGCQLEASYHCD